MNAPSPPPAATPGTTGGAKGTGAPMLASRESNNSEGGIPPVPLDQMLVLVNRFITSTSAFLNEFAAQAEDKLAELRSRTDALESNVTLLEGYLLEHDDGLGSTTPATTTKQPTTVASVQGSTAVHSMASSPPPPGAAAPLLRSGGEEQHQQQHQPASPSPSPEPLQAAVGVAKYVAMVRVGIPREAVMQRMTRDGIDPNLLP